MGSITHDMNKQQKTQQKSLQTGHLKPKKHRSHTFHNSNTTEKKEQIS